MGTTTTGLSGDPEWYRADFGDRQSHEKHLTPNARSSIMRIMGSIVLHIEIDKAGRDSPINIIAKYAVVLLLLNPPKTRIGCRRVSSQTAT